MKPALAGAAFAAWLVTNHLAHASPASADEMASSPMSRVDDEVRLRDGSLFRGTMTEFLPRDRVELLLPSGQKRVFAMSDVAYAGPSSNVATPPPSVALSPTAPAPERPAAASALVRLHLITRDTNVQFLARRSDDAAVHSYDILCVAPCDAQVAPGTYQLALARNGGRAIDGGPPITVDGSTSIEGTYARRGGLRAVGIVIVSTLVPIGALLAFLGVEEGNSPDCNVEDSGFATCGTPRQNSGLIAGGVALAIAGLGAGLPLILVRDGAKVEVVPLSTARFDRPGARVEGSGQASGVALRLSF